MEGGRGRKGRMGEEREGRRGGRGKEGKGKGCVMAFGGNGDGRPCSNALYKFLLHS